jgi:uncharacterized protein (TIGR02118 family)
VYRLTVCYGKPGDPAASDRHYAQVHIPLARQIPGLVAFTASHCAALDQSEPPYYWVAALDFATEEDFRAALGSPEMGKAVADVPNFATGSVTVFSQALADVLTAG